MKRVLIITYYWPPAGGPGVQRWLKFVKYLPEFGVDPVVYIPENPHYPIVDESFVAEIPAEIKIIKQPIREPYGWAKKVSGEKATEISKGIIPKKKPSFIEKMMLFVRGNFFIPDARVGWVNPSVNFLKTFLQKEKIETVITTGPPHSLHLIGLMLKKELGIKWVADFRDPWTTIHYHKELKLTSKSEKKHVKLESEVLKNADEIIVTSPSTEKEFKTKTPQPITLITNGFEANSINIESDTNFSIAHIGSLLSERNPEVLWEVLSELCQENAEFKDTLQINLAGTVSEDVVASIKQANLQSNLQILGYVSHDEALKLQKKSQVLLVIEKDSAETKAIIPGKIFECLEARRPILALGPAGSDINYILNKTDAGKFFRYSEKEALKNELQIYFKEFKKGNLNIESSNVSQFSRKNLTERLAKLLLS